MRVFNRKNVEPRVQGALIPLGEGSKKGAYISKLVKKKFYNYYNIKHRLAVCKMDAIAKRLTYKWADVATTKTFKFYSSHEVDATEVMEDVRAKWVELNCKEIFKKSIPPMVRDGFVLLDLINKGESIDYNVYGEYESPPQLWARGKENIILAYKVQFTPQPRGMGSQIQSLTLSTRGASNLREIDKDYTPKELIHIEYGEPNYGLGMPLIEGAWDSIIKLLGVSHQEMLDRRAVPTLYLLETDYSPTHDKAKEHLKMVANSSEDVARVWYRKLRKGTNEIIDSPKFGYESPTSTTDAGRKENKGVSTGDYGNINQEWTRLTTVTGHTINYYMGNRAGATVGSETDKASDDEQETIDFANVESIIRKILDWLDSEGLITMPTEPFVIKFWKDWEHIEKEAKKKEEMAAQLALGQTDENGNKPSITEKDKNLEIDSQDNKPKENDVLTTQKFDIKNAVLTTSILNAIKENLSYGMTYVTSSWIARIGYYDKTDRLYMELLDGKIYSKPSPMGEWSYLDWIAYGSKGMYFWDYLSQRDPPWMIDSIPADINIDLTPDEDIFNNSLKVPILDYEIIDSLDTEGKIKKLGKEVNWSMGNGTAANIKAMLNSLKTKTIKHQLRHNTMSAQAFGNSIKEGHPLLYDIGNGAIVEEYICPESWKENVGKTIPLGVYHNLDSIWESPELPDWQIVGTAEIFGWDDEEGEDYVKFNYEYKRIAEVFEKLDLFDWLTPQLKATKTADISTAYYCDIEYRWNETTEKVIRVQINIDLISISFVPRGNCPGEVCSIKIVAKNADAMQKYIKDCIAEGEDKGECLAKAYSKFKAKT